MTCIALIPARGGSRRIPKKAIKLFHGKPIISYSIEIAKESGLFDHIIVSTDDSVIANVATEYGAEVIMRPVDMAMDEVGTQEVAKYVLEQIEMRGHIKGIDRVAVIYPCSPLLERNDIKTAWTLLDQNSDYVVTVGANPLCDAGNLYLGWAESFRQDAPIFDPYTRMLLLPPERVCDVNTESDWKRCEEMYGEIHGTD